MEARKFRVAALCLCVLLLLVEQQQVAAMSEFCQCYRDCYSRCRHDGTPRWLCLPSCVNYCSSSPGPTSQAAVRDDGGATCKMACKLSVCGWSAAPDDAADAAICVQNCNRKWSHEAN